MRTALAVTADPTEWLTGLLGKLQPWVVASGVLLSASGAPAMDTLGLAPCSGYVAQLSGGEVGLRTSDFQVSLEERLVLYRNARGEAERAQAILRDLRDHLVLPEVRGYLDAIDAVLEPMPDVTDVIQAQTFTLGLHAARSRLLEDTASLRLWLKIAHVLAPDEEHHRIPERFVRRSTEEPDDEPLVFNPSSIGARRLVKTFLGEDADSSVGAA